MPLRRRASFDDTDRFEVLAELGSGGMGDVYAVLDKQLGEKVALKTLQRDDPGALLRLKNEFRALQDLQHPNLVNLGELFHDHEQWYFTMELIEGEDVVTYVRGSASDTLSAQSTARAAPLSLHRAGSRGDGGGCGEAAPFDESRLRHCLAQLAEGLGVLHAAGRIHRDIKPGNILVEPGGRLVLLDFGLVTQAEPGQESVEDHGFPLGTVGYMAPEQAGLQDLSPATDWYSVGVVLFEALTGKLPFSGSVFQVLADKQTEVPPRPRDLEPRVPDDLDELCFALLDREPRRRPGGEQVIRAGRHGAGGGTERVRAKAASAPAPIFVGRQRELGCIWSAYEEVVHGKAASVLVHGQSGVGKTELLRAFLRRVLARDERALVLHSRCYERESVPFKALDGAIDSLSQQLAGKPASAVAGLVPAHVSLLLRLFPVLGRVAAFRDAPRVRFEAEDLQEVRGLAFQALRELLVRLADTRVVILTMDDLQWADEDSKELIRALSRDKFGPQLLWLAVLRTGGDEQDAGQSIAGLLGVLPEPSTVLRLGPLSDGESRELAKALVARKGGLEDAEATQRLDQIAREAAGHPLFIRELAQHASASHEPQGPGTSPVRLDDALWARVGELDAPSRALVEVVATATGPVPQRIAASAAGLSEADMFKLAGRLRSQRLVRTSGPGPNDTIETYHDRVREAVLAKTQEPVLRSWHGKLADAMLASESQQAERLAFHLGSAGRKGEAARYAAQAAEQSAQTLAFKRAAELFQRALADWPAPESREQAEAIRLLRVKLGQALANAGRGADAADAYESAVAGAPPTEALVLKRRAAEQLLRSGHVERGLAVVKEVLAPLGLRLPQSTLGSLLALLWQRVRLRLRGLGFRVRQGSQIPIDALIQADVFNAVSQGLAMIDTIRGAYFSTRFVGLALDMGERTRVLRALWMEASYASNTGLPARYVSQLHAAMGSLVDAQEPVTRAYLDSARGCDLFMKGRWAEALKRFDATEQVFSARGGSVWERTTFRFFAIWSLYYLGHLEEMTRRVVPLYADAVDRGDLYAAGGLFLGLANLAHLNRLGVAETRRILGETTASWAGERYYLRDYYSLLAHVQVDLYHGDSSLAHERMRESWTGLSRSLLLMIPSVRIEADHLRARAALAAAADGEPSQRAALLDEARKHTRRLSRQRAEWARALALPLSAAIAMQQGKRERGIEVLRRALAALEEAELSLYAAAARWRLGEALGGDDGAAHVEQASRYFALQSVTEPGRMLAMLAPGFETAT